MAKKTKTTKTKAPKETFPFSQKNGSLVVISYSKDFGSDVYTFRDREELIDEVKSGNFTLDSTYRIFELGEELNFTVTFEAKHSLFVAPLRKAA